jgi:hypothetical protein
MKVYTRNDPCPFVKGEKILVSHTNHPDYDWLEGRQFHSFDKDIEQSFIVLDYREIQGFRYAKKIQPDLEVAKKVWVKGHHQNEWSERLFAEWHEDGYILCFDAELIPWDEYTLKDPNKHCCK